MHKFRMLAKDTIKAELKQFLFRVFKFSPFNGALIFLF